MKASSSRYRANHGGADPRVLHLKLRVVLTRSMTAETARKLVHQAVSDGVVPPGIELQWIDWAKGEEGRASEGRIYSGIREALRRFYGALTEGDTRFERVK